MDSLAVSVVDKSDNSTVQEVTAFLDACPTSFAQQTVQWRNVIAPIGPDEPFFIVCRQRGRMVAVLPAYRYDGTLGRILTTSSQAGALGGIACHAEEEMEKVYRAVLNAFVHFAQQNACSVATVLTNPFWPDHEICRKFLEPDFVLENNCQVLDLETAIDKNGQFRSATTNVRRNLKKAESGQLYVDEEQTERNVMHWYELHASRHLEMGLAPLPKAMFLGALEEMIPHDKGRFFFVRRRDDPDEMVAGGLYIYHGAVIDALMPSVRTEYRHLAPNYLLAAHTIRWARARGLRFYNWQASPPDSGVYRFKRQWGSSDAVYHFYTRITGDIESLIRSTAQDVRRAYPWHYVIPYDQLGSDLGTGMGASSRKSAWEAMIGKGN